MSLTDPDLSFQSRVLMWMRKCLTPKTVLSKSERNYRFFEEAVELVQSLDMSKVEALAMVEYVYSRPVGEPRQEVGGVMVTLAALCEANYIVMQWAAEDELARINSPEVIEIIRAKQRLKPHREIEQ